MRRRSSVKQEKERIKVVCRVRPVNDKEFSVSGEEKIVRVCDSSVFVKESAEESGTYSFTYDSAFGENSTQEEIFQNVANPLISEVFMGYNATLFAYGQTASGKTYTMEGTDIFDDNLKGMIPRSIDTMFKLISEADSSVEFTLKLSFVEIYLERIRDLLDDHRVKSNLNIREDKINGVYIEDVSEVFVGSKSEFMDVIKKGTANRAVAATGMNLGSSRSHSILTITVKQSRLSDGSIREGKLVFVDLAGSEAVRKTNAVGQQLEEAKMINKSLSALGNVINALTDGKSSHIPYRDSKLTRILQDSLGGNSKAALIIACSPSMYNAAETISTLRFGSRAKSIENKVKLNIVRTSEELSMLLMKSEEENERLKCLLLAYESKSSSYEQKSLKSMFPAVECGDDNSTPNESSLEEERESFDSFGDMKSNGNSLKEVIDEQSKLIDKLKNQLDEERLEVERRKAEHAHMSSLLALKDKKLNSLQSLIDSLSSAVEEKQAIITKTQGECLLLQDSYSILNESFEKLKTKDVPIGDNSGESKLDNVSGPSGEAPLKYYSLKLASSALKESITTWSSEVLDIVASHADSPHELLIGAINNWRVKSLLGQNNAIDSVITQLNDLMSKSLKKISECTNQRSGLVKDLQDQVVENIGLRGELDALKNKLAINPVIGSVGTEEQSLSQLRLNQLVEVHRQLLRRYKLLQDDYNTVYKSVVDKNKTIAAEREMHEDLLYYSLELCDKFNKEMADVREIVLKLRKNTHEDAIIRPIRFNLPDKWAKRAFQAQKEVSVIKRGDSVVLRGGVASERQVLVGGTPVKQMVHSYGESDVLYGEGTWTSSPGEHR